MADQEIDHFRRRMPSFLYVTVDYFSFRRQECPFNIWPGLYLGEALHGSGKTDNFLIPCTVGGWGNDFQTGHWLTLEKLHYYVYKCTNLRIRKPWLMALVLTQAKDGNFFSILEEGGFVWQGRASFHVQFQQICFHMKKTIIKRISHS